MGPRCQQIWSPALNALGRMLFNLGISRKMSRRLANLAVARDASDSTSLSGWPVQLLRALLFAAIQIV